MPDRPAISRLPFDPASKPQLGVEMFRLSSLYEREQRGLLHLPLASPKRLEFHTIYVGLHGTGELVVDFAPVPIGARRVTVVARGRIQQIPPQRRKVDAWMLLFTPELVVPPQPADPLAAPALLWPFDAVPSLALPAADHAELLGALAQLEAERARPLDRFQPLVLAALLRSFLLRLEREVAGPSPTGPLQRFFTILERDYARTREVAHYAREAGISARRLAELVHGKLGRSTKQVIDDRVILEHKRLLAHTELSVKELAAQTGFGEPTNLVKFFRLHTGITPLAFRERYRPAIDRRNSPSRRQS